MRKALIVGMVIVVLGAGSWHLSSFFKLSSKREHGYFLVEGERNKALHVQLRNVSPAIVEGPGNRLEALHKTLNELTYQDPAGRKWTVPTLTLNDGASVPPLLESFILGGLEGNARYAAIVHDYYCDEMERPRNDVVGGYPAIHRMFFHGLLCGNVTRFRAGLMYAAAVKYGPPQDYSLWMKVVAGERTDEVFALLQDPNHALSKWFREGDILGDDGILRRHDQPTEGDLRKARLAARAAQAAMTLAEVSVEEKMLALEEVKSGVDAHLQSEGAILRDELDVARREMKLSEAELSEAVANLLECEDWEASRQLKQQSLREDFRILVERLETLPVAEITPDRIDLILAE